MISEVAEKEKTISTLHSDISLHFSEVQSLKDMLASYTKEHTHLKQNSTITQVQSEQDDDIFAL